MRNALRSLFRPTYVLAFLCLMASTVLAQTGTFSSTGSMAKSRVSHTATLLTDGKVLVAGGFEIGYAGIPFSEIYDPVLGKFISVGLMNHGRYNYTATLLPNGKVLMAGGTGDGGVPLASAELYDPATAQFARSIRRPSFRMARC